MFVNPIRENLAVIGIIKEDPALPEESVMLHLRARGLSLQSRKNLSISLLTGFFIGILLTLTSLPIFLFKRLPSLLISVAAALIFFYFFDISFSDVLVYSLSLYFILNAHAMFWNVFLIIFDIIDILTYGSLTRLWLFTYFLRPDTHKEHCNTYLVTHIFCSRLLLVTDKLSAEEKTFLRQYESTVYDTEAKEKLVRSYWKHIETQQYNQ